MNFKSNKVKTFLNKNSMLFFQYLLLFCRLGNEAFVDEDYDLAIKVLHSISALPKFLKEDLIAMFYINLQQINTIF